MNIKTRLCGNKVTDAVAVERGYSWAIRAPRGHSVSWHRTKDRAEQYLKGYLRKTGCTVVDLMAEKMS